MSARFAARLLRWYDQHGRKDLPWQHPRTPYRVWVSEVMLQQTQVATVIGYFERFIARFPDVHALASAPLDDVLALWAGLGYYSRARNLHRAAQQCVREFAGELPRAVDDLARLPGIGASTAAAIAAQAHGTRAAILDGNVKRVLARHAGVRGAIDARDTVQTLWAHANARLPRTRMADYTQAIMDLGATVCTRSKPECARCPVRGDCVALRDDLIAVLPERKHARAVPVRHAQWLVIHDAQGRLLLERRPERGIWGGLWSLPECDTHTDARQHARKQYSVRASPAAAMREVKHRFTHFELRATPVRLAAVAKPATLLENMRWIGARQSESLGLPKPVRALLNEFWEHAPWRE
jgi:A/G-specific adenine glycosylase